MILLQLISYHFLHCEPLHSLTVAIGTIIGIGFIFAAILWCSCTCTTTRHGNKKHQRAPVSERVAFDGHGDEDESYVKIDLHNVSHLSMIVCNFMCIVQNSSEIPVTLYNAFFFLWTYSQLVLHCNACLQDSAATQITTVSIPVFATSDQDTSVLVSGDKVVSKQPSLPTRLYALSNSAHPTEVTETANPSQKPLVIISICSMYHC